MPSLTLFEDAGHANHVLGGSAPGLAVQANQHLVVEGRCGLLLDPGGHKVYSRAMVETARLLRGGKLTYLFFSHQDPDVVAAANAWLMTTQADAYVSTLWTRFLPHFGLDELVASRLKPIPDEGMLLDLAGVSLQILPAHFLHSAGNHQVYDPVAKILYSGDLGASLGIEYREVQDFDEHVPHMEPFHRRYMASGRALKAWARMVRPLEIDIIAPQHGAVLRGRALVERFIAWCEQLDCGLDLMQDAYRLPAGERP